MLIRAKSSALIVVFGPLLLILILGLSFANNDQYGVNIGVYSSSFSEDVNSVVSSLQEEFKVIKYEVSIEECVEDIKLEIVHACISLPNSFTVDTNTQKEITYYIDPSKINLVWMIQQNLQNKLSLKSAEISEELTQDILTRITEAKTKINTEKGNIATIKEKSDSAANNTDSTKNSLLGIDLIASTTEFDTSITTTFKDEVSILINSGISNINDANTAVDSITNITSSKEKAIKNALNEAKAQLDNATALFASTSTGSFTEIKTLITSLQTDLESTKTKLNTAAATVTSTTTSLEGVKNSITESAASLEIVGTALDNIKTGLEGQKVTEAGTIASPLITKIEKVSPERTHLGYSFPALIVIVVMFTSLLLGTILVMMEKKSPAFMRNFFLPVKKVIFIFSIYLTTLVLILIQLVIILSIALIFLSGVIEVIPITFLILFLSASIFTFLGMVLGYVFVSEETAVLASVSVGSLLLFLSGVILPIESVSPTIRAIAYFNPFVLTEKLIREVFIFNSAIVNIWLDLLILFVYAIILFIIILIVESFLHKNLLGKFLKHHHKKHRINQKKKVPGPTADYPMQQRPPMGQQEQSQEVNQQMPLGQVPQQQPAPNQPDPTQQQVPQQPNQQTQQPNLATNYQQPLPNQQFTQNPMLQQPIQNQQQSNQVPSQNNPQYQQNYPPKQ